MNDVRKGMAICREGQQVHEDDQRAVQVGYDHTFSPEDWGGPDPIRIQSESPLLLAVQHSLIIFRSVKHAR